MSGSNALHILGAIIGLCIIVAFTVAIAYDIVRKTLKKFALAKSRHYTNEDDNTSIDIRILIYVDLLLILSLMILITFNVVFSTTQTQCQTMTTLCMLVYHIIRFIMYSIFIRRIQIIYYDTVFELSSIHTYLLYGIITIYFIICKFVYVFSF